MSFFAVINTSEIPLDACQVTWSQSAIGEFSLSFPASYIRDRDTLKLADVAIYRNGVKFVSGVALDSPQLELSPTGVTMISLKCTDELGRLTCVRAKTDSHYQNTAVTAIINDLLASTPGWALTDTSSMTDPAVVTTVDLRNKEHLFAQVMETVSSVPRLFLRYGGFNVGLNRHEFHIGTFGEQENYSVQGSNLTTLKMRQNVKRCYRVLEGYGDRSGADKVTLKDALDNPSVPIHADFAAYPITLDVLSGKYVMTNTALSNGCSITKTFKVHKTSNNAPPTVTELQEAGLAVWQKGVRFFQQNGDYKSYSGSALFERPPRISSQCYVQAVVREPVYNQTTRQHELVDTFQIAEWLRITKITLQFKSAQAYADNLLWPQIKDFEEYALELQDNAYAEDYDDDIELYDRLERFDSNDNIPAIIGILRTDYVSIQHTNADVADCTVNFANGKKYVFTLPTPPPGATQVFATVAATVPAQNVTVTITQNPSLPSTSAEACVQINGSWPPAVGQPVTVTMRYEFH